MMENKIPCICGHTFKWHFIADPTIIDCYKKLSSTPGHIEICKCRKYVPDNLKLIEQKFEAREKANV